VINPEIGRIRRLSAGDPKPYDRCQCNNMHPVHCSPSSPRVLVPPKKPILKMISFWCTLHPDKKMGHKNLCAWYHDLPRSVPWLLPHRCSIISAERPNKDAVCSCSRASKGLLLAMGTRCCESQEQWFIPPRPPRTISTLSEI